MSSTKKIAILGTAGNCIDILDALLEINERWGAAVYECVGFFDDDEDKWGSKAHGFEVLGPLDAAVKLKDVFFVNGIGSQSNFWKKESIIARTGVPLARFETVIHPSASVSKMSSIGAGTAILQNVTVAAGATIGNHVMVLPGAVISHDDSIGDFTAIASGVCVSGGVSIGKSCYLGANCSIINGVSIGDYCLVGMGGVVLNDVEANSVVVGNPAKFLRHLR